jgi:uncharacterized BrkB/YihY/UPF0761 family membrane protein
MHYRAGLSAAFSVWRSPSYHEAVDRTEFEDYRRHHLKVRRRSFYAMIGMSVVIGFAVTSLWTFVGGAVLAVLLMLAGLETHMLWDKARWIKRFPELANPTVTWRRR